MKKLVLTVVCLVGIAAFLSCKREKSGDAVPPWNFRFILIDSLGNKLFSDPPPDFGAIPFDPKKSYWIDGTGKRQAIGLQGTDSLGLIFALGESLGHLKLDTNFNKSNFIHLKIYFNSDSSPVHFKVVNPINTYQVGDFLLWNEDTLDHLPGSGIPEIVYP